MLLPNELHFERFGCRAFHNSAHAIKHLAPSRDGCSRNNQIIRSCGLISATKFDHPWCEEIAHADDVEASWDVGCVKRQRNAPLPTRCYNKDMSHYLRNRNGQIYFFTIATDHRQPILTTDLGRSTLREAISKVRREAPFQIAAIVLLPDHLHAIWELPPGDMDYSTRWKRIKTHFTNQWRRQGGATTVRSESRKKRSEQGVWQRRFFEHTCRDARDTKRCLDYLHVNPVRHGLVQRVQDWPWSSFHRYAALGEYSSNWGSESDWYGDEFRRFE